MFFFEIIVEKANLTRLHFKTGFITACTVQPFMINESTEDADLDALAGTDERSHKYRGTMYQQPRVQANLRKLIPIYDQLGLFFIIILHFFLL